MAQNNISFNTSSTYTYTYYTHNTNTSSNIDTNNNIGTSIIGEDWIGYWQTTDDEFNIWSYEQVVDFMKQTNIIKGPYKKENNGQLYFDI